MKVRRCQTACVGLVTVAVLVASSSGCARWRRQARSKQAGSPTASTGAPTSAAQSEAVRNRAISMLEAMAADPNPQIRANALEALAEAPARLEPLIPRALQDQNLGVRSAAAMMVGKVPIRSAAGQARVLLRDPSPYVRASAIYAMKRCGEQVDISPLAGMLLSDPSPRVRAHAAYLIGELGESSALPMLQEASTAPMTKAPPSEIRLLQLQIAEAMVKLGDDRQLEVLRAALYPSRPEDLEVTALAVQIIGQIRDRGAIDQLIYLTAYRDPKEGQMPAEIRLGAAMALARLGKTEGSFIVNEYADSELPVLRAQAALAYGHIGRTENLSKLEQMLQDPEGITRVSAAAGILKVGSSMAGHSGL
jgi:HEAT repeat protein